MLHEFSIFRLQSTLKLQVLSVIRESDFPSESAGLAEAMKPVNILYILLVAEVKENIRLLRRGKVDWIVTGSDLEGE